MTKQSEIDRMLVLIFRSNNSQSYVNFTRPYGWLDKLPMVGLDELSATLAAMQRDVDAEVSRRRSIGMTQFAPSHYADRPASEAHKEGRE